MAAAAAAARVRGRREERGPFDSTSSWFQAGFFLVFACLCDVRLRRSTSAHISWQRQRGRVCPSVLSIRPHGAPP